MDCTALILTYNESKHLSRCLDSLSELFSEVVVIDSFSTDNTTLIAKKYGVTLVQNEFINQAQQLNWYLDNHKIDSEWIFRIDADEVITPELRSNLEGGLDYISNSVSGITINRRIYFLGKWIRHGGIYPIPVLRLWRNGRGYCENRWMDEHIIVQGEVEHVSGDISDINLNNLSWWVDKHNNYASREAVEVVLSQTRESKSNDMKMSANASRKRWIKRVVYSRIPLGIRAVLYFTYRYIFLAGFLDGSKGFAFHLFQGLWYRLLVDYKVLELRLLVKSNNKDLRSIILDEYGYDVSKFDALNNKK